MDDSDGTGWFDGVDPEDIDKAVRGIQHGSAPEPNAWPALAVADGTVRDTARYYERLHAATCAAAIQAVETRGLADDEQVKHAIRTLDDLDRMQNELAERLAEWATAANLAVDPRPAAIVELSSHTPATPIERRLVALASIVAAMRDEREAVADDIERIMHAIAPNVTALAGPYLGARLIALAGSLESLAKMPSGTVQVLGAENALFAHLHRGAPPPKHGLIYTHEYVRGTRSEKRGSAARALAGKLAIAARIDHYAGDHRPELEQQLDARIARIRGGA